MRTKVYNVTRTPLRKKYKAVTFFSPKRRQVGRIKLHGRICQKYCLHSSIANVVLAILALQLDDSLAVVRGMKCIARFEVVSHRSSSGQGYHQFALQSHKKSPPTTQLWWCLRGLILHSSPSETHNRSPASACCHFKHSVVSLSFIVFQTCLHVTKDKHRLVRIQKCVRVAVDTDIFDVVRLRRSCRSAWNLWSSILFISSKKAQLSFVWTTIAGFLTSDTLAKGLLWRSGFLYGVQDLANLACVQGWGCTDVMVPIGPSLTTWRGGSQGMLSNMWKELAESFDIDPMKELFHFNVCLLLVPHEKTGRTWRIPERSIGVVPGLLSHRAWSCTWKKMLPPL